MGVITFTLSFDAFQKRSTYPFRIPPGGRVFRVESSRNFLRW